MVNKLSVKIGVLFFGFIVIIESLLFFILYINLENDRIDEVMGGLLARGNSHRDVLESKFDQTTMEHVSLMESASEFIVVITDEAGNIMESSEHVDAEMKQVIQLSEGTAIAKKGEIVEDKWKDSMYIATDSPITINDKHKGHVFMFAHTSYVKKIVDQLSNQFVVISVITVLLTIVAILILSRVITLPLIRMKEATEKLSLGENKVELTTSRQDELGELANSITKLSNDLEEMKRARNEFLASIAHELRTPLTYIKGYADIINRQDLSQKEVVEYAGVIREEAEQLTALIKQLFDLAKMDQHNFVIEKQHVKLCSIIQKVLERMQPVFDEKQLSIKVSCGQHITAFIDPERMQQVLMNILDNARKHSRTGGSVSVSVVDEPNEVVVIIKDEGEGIPAADLPYIFDRLYRVEKSRSRKSGGIGLGLSIAKEIVESHGGSIHIESEQRAGTKVRIHLSKR